MKLLKELYDDAYSSLKRLDKEYKLESEEFKSLKAIKDLKEQINILVNKLEHRRTQDKYSIKRFDIDEKSIKEIQKKIEELENVFYGTRGYVYDFEDLQKKMLHEQTNLSLSKGDREFNEKNEFIDTLLKKNYPNLFETEENKINEHLFAHIFTDIQNAAKEKKDFKLEDFEKSLNDYLKKNGIIGKEDSIAFNTYFQPLTNVDGTIVDKFDIKQKLILDLKGRVSEKHKAFLKDMLLEIEKQSDYFLSGYLNGKEGKLVDRTDNISAQIQKLLIDKKIDINPLYLDHCKKSMSQEVFEANINGIKTKNPVNGTKDFSYLSKKETNNPLVLGKDFTYSITIGQNDINENTLDTLKGLDKLLRNNIQIDLSSEHIPCLDTRHINKNTFKQDEPAFAKDIDILIKIGEEIKTMGTKISLEEIDSDERMYKRIDNMHELFGNSFKDFSVSKDITKRLNIYTVLKKLDINNLDYTIPKNIEKIRTTIKDNKELFKSCGINIDTIDDFYDNSKRLTIIANRGIHDFLKLNYYNTHIINDDLKETFYSDKYMNKSTKPLLINHDELFGEFKFKYGNTMKPIENIKGINYYDMECQLGCDFVSEFNQTNGIKVESSFQRGKEHYDPIALKTVKTPETKPTIGNVGVDKF